jgi:molecular chaperone DnaJ
VNPYQVLGVSPGASAEEIREAYMKLVKKYHPDRYQDSDLKKQAEDKMKQINAAYDLLTKKQGGSAGAQQGSYGPGSSQSGAGYGSYGGYGGYGSAGAYQQQYSYAGWDNGAQARQTERSEYTAAVNFIRNGMYREAINALSGVPAEERDGKWYYLMAGANMYLGNKVAALEHAKQAVSLDPNNPEYRRLLEQLKMGGDFYENYANTYTQARNINPIWLWLCAASLCTGGRLPLLCCC